MNTLRQAAATLAAIIFALGLLASPASAADDIGPGPGVAADGRTVSAKVLAAGRADCPSTWFCVWADPNFSNGPGKWQNNEENYGAWWTGRCDSYSWNECASSVFNNGSRCKVTFYENAYYNEEPGAFFYALPRGSYLANLAYDKWSDGTSPDNKISSHRWVC